MHVRSVMVSLVVFQLAIVAGGCGNGGWPSRGESKQAGSSAHADGRLSGVAVVDLDEVAKQLGIDVALVKQINDGQASLNQQLRTLQTSLSEQFQEKVRVLKSNSLGNGSNLDSAAQKQQLAGLERELNLQLNQAKQTAQKELSVYRQRLIQSFRSEVVPVAREVAVERGLGVVITKNDTVLLAFDDAHDITAALIARLRAKRAAGHDPRASTASRPAPSDTTYR